MNYLNSLKEQFDTNELAYIVWNKPYLFSISLFHKKYF